MYNPEELEIVNAIEDNEAEKQSFDNENLKAMATQTLTYLNTKNKLALISSSLT